jgi:hypothetical protein
MLMITTHIHLFIDVPILETYIQKNIRLFGQHSQLLIQLFLISTDEEYIAKIQKTLHMLLPDAHIIGATTDGSIIYKGDPDVTTISFTQFEKSELKHILVPFELTKEDICAQTISKKILSEKSKVLILFGDGLLCNASKLTREIHAQYPHLIIAGGLAGDNARLEKTLVCDNETCASQAVVALSIESDSLYVHNDYNLAWEALGVKMEITKCHENIIYEIDGKKASHIYKKYLDTKYLEHYETDENKPTISIEFPLIIEREAMNIARVTMQVNNDGSIFCTGEFVEGDIISFSFTDSSKIIKSGLELSQRMLKAPVQTIFAYSCMARRRFMGENLVHDLEPLQSIAPISGFYSYGEIYTTPKNVEMLNHTMTILALSEEEDIYSSRIESTPKVHSKSSQTLNAFYSLLSNSNIIKPTVENINYNQISMELYLKGERVKMSKSESKLFKILFENKNRPIDSETIFSYVWEDSSKEFGTDSVRALVKKLRQKLPPQSIENLYGGFYSLKLSN